MTSIKNKIENISESIQNINAILSSFSDYEQIPNIDIDLLKDKLRKVYDDIDTINKLDNEIEQVITKTDENINIEEKNIVNNKSEIEESLEIKEEIIVEAPLNEDISEVELDIEKEVAEEYIETDETTKDIVEEKTEEQEDVVENSDIELLANTDVKEIISEFKNATDLASQLQFKPIDDINNAVSINDRVGFINEIFGGNAESYSDCVSKLNNASDLNNAVNILDNSQKWDKENPIHKSFLEIVYRRFI